jgi:hypothetical protein
MRRNRAGGKNAKTSRKKKKTALGSLDPNQSLTISDFCELEQFSRRFFYNLERQGKAPATYKAGVLRRITPQAHAAWRAERQAESSQEAA